MSNLACSLATILKKRTLLPSKLDEIQVKANILNAFRKIEEKLEEAEAKAEEVLGRDTAEL